MVCTYCDFDLMLVADVPFVSLVLMDRDLPLVLCVCGVWVRVGGGYWIKSRNS